MATKNCTSSRLVATVVNPCSEPHSGATCFSRCWSRYEKSISLSSSDMSSCPSTFTFDQRTPRPYSFDGDAGLETGVCAARPGPDAPSPQPRATRTLRAHSAAHLAEAFLRFQYLDRPQASRETPLSPS